VRDPELRQAVYLARHGIRIADFEEFDPVTLSACAIICAEIESGERWDFTECKLVSAGR
jgi:hypothetical protein